MRKDVRYVRINILMGSWMDEGINEKQIHSHIKKNGEGCYECKVHFRPSLTSPGIKWEAGRGRGRNNPRLRLRPDPQTETEM